MRYDDLTVCLGSIVLKYVRTYVCVCVCVCVCDVQCSVNVSIVGNVKPETTSKSTFASS